VSGPGRRAEALAGFREAVELDPDLAAELAGSVADLTAGTS
jgi:hypothetical protein